MGTQLNIVNALRYRLPLLSRKVPRGITVDTRGSTNTQGRVPLRIWKDPTIDYFSCAEKSIEELESLKKFQSQQLIEAIGLQLQPDSKHTGLLNKWTPDPKTATLQNEADVSHASSVVLINLVSLLLQELVPQLRIRHRFESQVDSSKRDLLWEYKRPGTPNVPEGKEDPYWQEFAILEYKKTNVIDKEHFAPGHLRAVESETKPGAVPSLTELLSIAKTRPKGTFLRDNAVILTQQAVKYSNRAKHIMLFDWDTMAVFDFTEGIEDMANIFFFQEEEVPDNSGKTFRTLLLGFLKHSLEDTLKKNNLSLTD